MSYSYSQTESFTRTSAKRVAAKVAGDLNYMRALYGQPAIEKIGDFEDEVVELLIGRYLDTVTYGFRRNENWVAGLRYVADTSGNLIGDDPVGKLDPNAQLSGATFYSYLTHSTSWSLLSAAERERIEAGLAIKRSTGTEPGTAGGYWSQDKTYSADGGGVRRSTFRSYG